MFHYPGASLFNAAIFTSLRSTCFTPPVGIATRTKEMEHRPFADREVVDLLSDDDDDDDEEEEEEEEEEEDKEEGLAFDAFLNPDGVFDGNAREEIDLTLSDASESPPTLVGLLSEEACLQMVLDVFPDMAVNHALELIQQKTKDQSRTSVECERLIAAILDDSAYPKEQDEVKATKRKRNSDEDFSEFENGGPAIDVPGYNHNVLDLLKDEFLDLPVKHLAHVLQQQKSLFKAYGVIEEQLRNYRSVAGPVRKISKPRYSRKNESTLIRAGSALPKELQAARRKSEAAAVKRRKVEQETLAEQENLRLAQMTNSLKECQCCFDDVPLNRTVTCSGEAIHFFCLECARQYVETEMGSARCRPVCFADQACGGTFSRRQLQKFLGDKSFDRLEHMQQQQDLAAAGLDDLSECPFCDFKADYPPVEVDREFRCLNPKCEKTSCRICQRETHIPLSCEEAKKDGQITIRHVIEEAMSAALIRHCNRCRNPFVKENGCNKMTCSKCQNVQCYVCSKDIVDYKHFMDAYAPGLCPLHDNVEDRHEKEVTKAAEEAMAKVRAENPDMPEHYLMVKVSDRVLKEEQRKRSQAQVAHDRFPWQMRHGGLVDAHAPMAPRLARPQPVQPNVGWQHGYPEPAPHVRIARPQAAHHLGMFAQPQFLLPLEAFPPPPPQPGPPYYAAAPPALAPPPPPPPPQYVHIGQLPQAGRQPPLPGPPVDPHAHAFAPRYQGWHHLHPSRNMNQLPYQHMNQHPPNGFN